MIVGVIPGGLPPIERSLALVPAGPISGQLMAAAQIEARIKHYLMRMCNIRDPRRRARRERTFCTLRPLPIQAKMAPGHKREQNGSEASNIKCAEMANVTHCGLKQWRLDEVHRLTVNTNN